jgi:signal transduction histidine kinase
MLGNFYLFQSISSYFQPNLKFLNDDLSESKARFILYFCFATGLMTCVSSAIRFFQHDVLPLSWYLIALFSLFNVFVPLICSTFGHYKKVILFSMSYGALILALRILDTGGYEGSTLAWITIVPIIFGHISDRKGLLVSTLLSVLFLFFLTAYAETLGLVSYIEETIFTRFVVWALLILLIGFMVGIFVRQKKERERELQYSLESLRLTQKLASLGTIAAGVAHQVNNPLMNIMGQLELMRRLSIVELLDSNIATRYEKHFSRVEGNFKKINSIINALLVIGRSKPMESFSLCSIENIIDQSIEFAQVKHPTRSIAVCRDEIRNHQFFGNEVLLIQMFGNIFSNAFDATNDHDEPFVKIEFHETGLSFDFEIQNSGPKIDDDIIQSIFDPFFTTKKISDGSGLGLVLSRTIVELHGGTLYYDAKASLTTFRITLPKRENA